MRLFETILKLLFLIGSAAFIITQSVASPWFVAYLFLGLILGATLMLNDKSPSYRYPSGYKKNSRVLAMRRFEGALMIIFVVYVMSVIYA